MIKDKKQDLNTRPTISVVFPEWKTIFFFNQFNLFITYQGPRFVRFMNKNAKKSRDTATFKYWAEIQKVNY